MLILLPVLLIFMALLYGSTTSQYMQFELYLKSLKNPYYRLGVSYEPASDYKYEGYTYSVTQLVVGLLLLNIWITFYTIKEDDTTINSTTPTILG